MVISIQDIQTRVLPTHVDDFTLKDKNTMESQVGKLTIRRIKAVMAPIERRLSADKYLHLSLQMFRSMGTLEPLRISKHRTFHFANVNMKKLIYIVIRFFGSETVRNIAFDFFCGLMDE